MVRYGVCVCVFVFVSVCVRVRAVWDRISLHSPGCSGTHYHQARFKLRSATNLGTQLTTMCAHACMLMYIHFLINVYVSEQIIQNLHNLTCVLSGPSDEGEEEIEDDTVTNGSWALPDALISSLGTSLAFWAWSNNLACISNVDSQLCWMFRTTGDNFLIGTLK
jgi:hypothetical protein